MTLSTWPPLVFVFFPIIFHLGHPLVSLHNNGFCPDFVVNGVPLSKNLKKYEVSYSLSKTHYILISFCKGFSLPLPRDPCRASLWNTMCHPWNRSKCYFMWSIIITLSRIYYILYKDIKVAPACVLFFLPPGSGRPLNGKGFFSERPSWWTTWKYYHQISLFFVLFFFYEKTILH